MKISLNIMKQLTGLDLKADEVVEKINLQLGQVEAVEGLDEKYSGVVIAKVISQEKHPNADKLSFCRIDDGRVVADVTRDENGYVEVVCGAPNVREGLFVAWLPPGSTVPATYQDAEPFVLEPKELRGIVSNGMIASVKELDLGDDHNGILELTNEDLPPTGSVTELSAGLSFAEVFGLNDTIIELENKMFTHRPDCFGQLGVARELSAITLGLPPDTELGEDTRFENPDWYWLKPEFKTAEGLELTVFNDVPDKAARFMAVAMRIDKVRPSPLWLQIELVRMGGKAINTIVDLTNYIMLMTGQPTHAYDYDKLAGKKLGVRMATAGESASLLNSKSYTLTADDIVIADERSVIGLAGIMGGSTTEVSPETKNIVLEVANFDMYTLRRSSMRYGLFTDALTRFSKGQSKLQNDRVLARLMQLMSDIAGAQQASAVFEQPRPPRLDEVSLSGEIVVNTEFINSRLGLELSEKQIGALLRRANFAAYSAENDQQQLLITAPFWRTDIELPEDIVEEVGRLYGYDKLNHELPARTIIPAPKNPTVEVKRLLREKLAKAGANELLTYSFVHENTLKKATQDSSRAFQLSNALSPDLQYFRLSVLPSLLEKVHPNIKSGYDEFVLFEIGKGHDKHDHGQDDSGLPRELEFLDLVYASKKVGRGAAYFHVQRYVRQLAHDLGFELTVSPITEPLDYPVTASFDQSRSALLQTSDGVFIGIVGELKAEVVRNFKLPSYVAAASLDIEGLEKAYVAKTYQPLSRFPSVSQDISLKVSNDVSYARLFECAETIVSKLPHSRSLLTPLSIYKSDNDTAHKTITLRLTVADYEKTLTDHDVSQILEHIATTAHESCDAERV